MLSWGFKFSVKVNWMRQWCNAQWNQINHCSRQNRSRNDTQNKSLGNVIFTLKYFTFLSHGLKAKFKNALPHCITNFLLLICMHLCVCFCTIKLNNHKSKFSNNGVFSTQLHSLNCRKCKTEKLTSWELILFSERQSYDSELRIKL